MKHIRFSNLDDLFSFAGHCARGEALGRRGRSAYDQVYLADKHYALAYAPQDWDESGHHFGGRIHEGPPGGQPLRLNEVMLCLHLRAMPPQRSVAVPSLVVAVPAESSLPSTEMQRRLHEAARDVPRREGAITQFYFRAASDRDACCHVALIHEVDTGFAIKNFREKHPEPVKVFVPAWDHAECHLFVEWGYAYPKPIEFSRLYDVESAAGRNAGGRHLVLATAGDTVNLPHAAGGGGETWFKPRWHLVGAESFRTAEDVYRVDFGSPPDVALFSQVDDGAEAVPMTVEIGRVTDAVGSRTEIEKRISLHERELELLYNRRERLGNIDRRDYRAVFVWRQQDNPDGQRLPAALEEFLKKPLSELARHTYARVEVAGGWHHYVATEMHLPAGRALAVPCDQTYLCDARWIDWGLPLYVRSDCSLSVAIEEFDLAAKVRGLLEGEGVSADVQIILAEPYAGKNGETGPGLHAIRFTRLSAQTPLHEALRLLNAHAGGPSSVAQLGGALADGAVIPHDIETSAAASELDRVLLERATALVASSESAWEQLRTRLQTISLDTHVTNLVLGITEDCYSQAAGIWTEFVNAVFAADERIARLKLEGLHAWVQTEEERQRRLETIRRGQLNVDEEIQARKEEYDQKLPELEATSRRIAQHLETLAQSRAKLDTAKKAIEEKMAKLTAANAELERANTEQEARLNDARQRLGLVEAQEDRLNAQIDELARIEQDIRECKDRCKVQDEDFQTRLAALQATAERAFRFIKENEPPPPPPPVPVVLPDAAPHLPPSRKKRSFLGRMFGWLGRRDGGRER